MNWPLYKDMTGLIDPDDVKERTPKLWSIATRDGKRDLAMTFHIFSPGKVELVAFPMEGPHAKILATDIVRTYAKEMQATVVTVLWEAWTALNSDPHDRRLPSDRAAHERTEHVMLYVQKADRPIETYMWQIHRLANRAYLGNRMDWNTQFISREIGAHFQNLVPCRPN